MSRIEQTFERLKARGEKALIPYIMAGDPYLERTEELVLTLEESGADLIELGIPFSDPIADGPVIQRAGQRALKWHTSLRDVLRLVEDLRQKTQIPLIFMSYINPIHKYGQSRFVRDAVSVGVDGLIVPDLPPEEGRPFFQEAGRNGLDMILLAAPTSSRKRIKMIAEMANGFLYYVSITGITGAKLQGMQEIKSRISGIRSMTNKPIAVGFGVSTPEQAASLARVADGVIVGSAIVKRIEAQADQPDLLTNVGEFVRQLKRPLMRGRKKRPLRPTNSIET